MRIGIDGRVLEGNRSGVGRYVFELCRRLDALLPDAQFYVYSPAPVEMPVRSPRWIARVDPHPLAARLKRLLWLKLCCGGMCAADSLDVFWGASTTLPPLPAGVRTVVTVYDLNYKVVPETMPSFLRWGHVLFFRRDVARADAVISISQGTRARLRDLLGIESQAVVQPSVDERFGPRSETEVSAVLAKYKIAAPYILGVSTLEPRKNMALTVRVFERLKEAGLIPRHKLVLAGGGGWKNRKLLETAAANRDIILTGYADDADLPPLYCGASLFMFPSLYEGFGIPVLEALRCGARVVASDIPELREAGGADAVYARPNDDAMFEAAKTALSMPKPAPVTRFVPSWEDGAEKMVPLLAASGKRIGFLRTGPAVRSV